MKSFFKTKINWDKYQLKVAMQEQNPWLHFLIGAGFQGVNRYFVLLFENNAFG